MQTNRTTEGGKMSRLEEIQARAEAATEGPWSIWHDLDHQGFKTVGDAESYQEVLETGETDESNPTAHVYTEHDAEFIAHAREDAPWLIRRVQRLVRALLILRRRNLTEYRRGHRDGYRAARDDIASGAFIGGPNYDAIKATPAVRKALAEAWDKGYTRAERDHYETGFYTERLRDNPYKP
jgi:hypothetical protein